MHNLACVRTRDNTMCEGVHSKTHACVCKLKILYMYVCVCACECVRVRMYACMIKHRFMDADMRPQKIRKCVCMYL